MAVCTSVHLYYNILLLCMRYTMYVEEKTNYVHRHDNQARIVYFLCIHVAVTLYTYLGPQLYHTCIDSWTQNKTSSLL